MSDAPLDRCTVYAWTEHHDILGRLYAGNRTNLHITTLLKYKQSIGFSCSLNLSGGAWEPRLRFSECAGDIAGFVLTIIPTSRSIQ